MKAARRFATIAPVMSYSLRPGISFCAVDDRLIFLDVDRDRYFCLTRPVEARLRDAAGSSEPLTDPAGLDSLVAQRLLVPTADPVPLRACAPPASPTSSLLDSAADAPLRSILQATTVMATSLVRLRWRSLEANLLSAIAARRGAERDDRGLLNDVSASFQAAARLITLHDRCLAQSLAVARTVFARGGWAQVVLGVTLGPFTAHCWVQSGTVVINDRVDRVGAYTPILVL